MSASRQPTEAEKAEEKNRRLAEQAKWTNQQEWFAKFYAADRSVNRLSWERVEGEQTEDELEDIKKTAGLGPNNQSVADISNSPDDKDIPPATYRITDGLFKAVEGSPYHTNQSNRQFFIQLQDGVARPRPPLLETEFASHQGLYMQKFNAVYGQIMDFMATKCGYSKVVFDVPDMSPLMSQYDHMRLNAAIELAKQRGLHLSFGPRIMEQLRDRPTEYAQYTDRLKKVNAISHLAKNKAAIFENDYKLTARELNDKPRDEKYLEAINASVQTKNPAELMGGLDKALEDLDARVKALNANLDAVKKNNADFEAEIEGLNTTNTTGDLRKEKQRPKRDGKLLHGNEEGNEVAIKAAETYVNDGNVQAARETLKDAMLAERAELVKRQEFLAKTFDKSLKTDVLEKLVGKDGKPLSDEQKASVLKRREALETRLTNAKNSLEASNEPAIEKACVQDVAALKDKVAEKKKALEDPNQAAAGPPAPR